jgi:hypothetical protein
MPRIVDTGYNAVLSKPNYYNDEQKSEFLNKRIQDVIFENKVPPIPTRQQELDYIENLENDFRSDKWLHLRFRKMQAGPLRSPYKRTRVLLQEYRINYFFNFCIGSLVSAPLAIWMGRRNRTTSGGVPVVYHPKNYHNFPNINPDHTARWRFRIGFYGTLIMAGWVFAEVMTVRPFKDEYYSRPDFKPDTPMVEDTEDIAEAKKQFYSTVYGDGAAEKRKNIYHNSPLYRLFRPSQAEYKIRYEQRDENPYNSYNRKRGAYPSDSRMHEQHW